MEQLLDAEAFSPALLDQVAAAALGAASDQASRARAAAVLARWQESEQASQLLPAILDSPACSLPAKFVALQVLEGVVRCKWLSLDAHERDEMRNRTTRLLLEMSAALADSEHAGESRMAGNSCDACSDSCHRARTAAARAREAWSEAAPRAAAATWSSSAGEKASASSSCSICWSPPDGQPFQKHQVAPTGKHERKRVGMCFREPPLPEVSTY
eukprot:TRINITY_DN4909_c0_g1_i1.p2 TRINITY_DN4909_c0_g1~~TRINITY_DN4909_c0_g1_i1.p2  ORF type:complete len:214 (+),score=57.93 TRINITY_DN4909_c0_g1_i1:645-1286(+)